MDPRDVLKMATEAAPRIDSGEEDADLPMAPTCWVLQDSLRELAEARRMRARVARSCSELRYRPRPRGSASRRLGQG